ncbi:hypothetical protein ACPB9E_37245 [Streptomyces exfoliatus]|uniref:hypothetical protein n=1 Tax=Streptomyces exfoliatus TaxID=1905 RepID=UPI003C2C1AD5
MSTARRRPLGSGCTDLPEPAARDPRAMTAAERAAACNWTPEPTLAPAPAALPESRLGRRRRLSPGLADPGATPTLDRP